ncbi:sulfite exporter TauE/SafE family protein [Advenella kashmirensis]
MDWYLNLLLFVSLGAAIGFVGAIVGIGGGLIAIPMLALVFSMPQQLAQGTALLMIGSNVVLTLRNYHKRSPIDFRSVAIGVAANVVATHLAALVAQDMSPVVLRNLFALFLGSVATFYVWQTLRTGKKREAAVAGPARPMGFIQYVILGSISGAIGGLFGVGGSLILVPVMTVFYRFRQTSAQAMALSMILPGTLVALITYSWHGNTDWTVGIALSLGGMLMIRQGVRLAFYLPERTLKFIFAGVLYLTVALLLLK